MRKNIIIMFIALVLCACSATQNVKKNNEDVGTINKYEYFEKLNEVSEEIISSKAFNDSKIAIMPFSTKMGITELSELLSEQLSLELVKKKKIEVIERKELENILMEKRLSLEGITTGENVDEIITLKEVEFIVMGNIIESNYAVILNLRVVSTKTGKIEFKSMKEIKLPDNILSLNKNIKEKIENRKLPLWIKENKKNGYITAIGMSKIKNGDVQKSELTAKMIARAELAKQIKIKIETLDELKTKGNKDYTEEEYLFFSRQTSEEVMKNIEILETFQDDKEYYVLMGIKTVK